MIAVARQHSSLQSYVSSVKSNFNKTNVGVAEGSVYHGARFDEHESVKSGNRHTRMSGRELLGAVAAIGNSGDPLVINQGSRFGVFPIAPKWLGGRPAYFADTFQQHKAHRLRVIYEPLVPTTTGGSVVIYFNADIGVPTVQLGISELKHAATHEFFLETPVWQSSTLEIDPQSALNKYFDQTTGDPRLQIQGVIVCESGSDLSTTSGTAFGHLYLEYDIEFFTESLDYSVPNMPTIELMLNANVPTVQDTGDAFYFVAAGVPGAVPTFSWKTDGQQAFGSDGDLSGVVAALRVSQPTPTFGSTTAEVAWRTVSNSTVNYFQLGQFIYARFYIVAGFHYVMFFTDLASALSADSGSKPESGSTAGNIRYAADIAMNGSGQLFLYGQYVALDNE